MFKCDTRIRVRYGETDQMGVAHHGAMVNWLEAARVDWCRKAGVPYRDVEAAGFNMAVVELQVRYLCPLFFDEEIRIETMTEKFTRKLIHFHYRVLNRDGELAAEGDTRHLVVNTDLKRVSLSAELMTRFLAGMRPDA
ncbi:MAG: acyl-CoA thioesterase [Acidobacteria bacterium]|nr:acyl-CoA thioesterase [Acidobacteriota bacterium]